MNRIIFSAFTISICIHVAILSALALRPAIAGQHFTSYGMTLVVQVQNVSRKPAPHIERHRIENQFVRRRPAQNKVSKQFLARQYMADEGDGMGIKENDPLLDRLFHQIDNLLFYPDALTRNGVDGSVRARLVINQDGNCNRSAVLKSDSDANLQDYIRSVLATVCRENFGHFMRGRKPINVELTFDFQIGKKAARQPPERRNAIVGHRLLFYRG